LIRLWIWFPPSEALGGSGSLRERAGNSAADVAGSALVEKAPATRTFAEEEALFVGAINLPDG